MPSEADIPCLVLDGVARLLDLMAATFAPPASLGDGSFATDLYTVFWVQFSPDCYQCEFIFGMNSFQFIDARAAVSSLTECPWIEKVMAVDLAIVFSIQRESATLQQLERWLEKHWSTSRWERWRR